MFFNFNKQTFINFILNLCFKISSMLPLCTLWLFGEPPILMLSLCRGAGDKVFAKIQLNF